MVTELQETYASVMYAVCAEDIFGEVFGQDIKARLKNLEKTYHSLSRATHPDRFADNLDDKEMAEESFKRMGDFYERAKLKIESGTYGNKSEARQAAFIIQTPKRRYNIFKALAEGDLSMVYEGECVDSDDFAGRVVVKILNDKADNRLMQKEIRFLKAIIAEPTAQNKHFPLLLDEFRTADGKNGIVLRYFDGYDFQTTLESSVYQKGVPKKAAVWMLNRTLSAIGRAHYMGFTHNNINPTHLMIKRQKGVNDHNISVVDWSYSSFKPEATGERFVFCDEDFSAPEVLEKKPPVPASDLYSIGKSMIYILGGDIKTNELPDEVEPKLQRFLKWFTWKSPFQRPQDAWETHAMLIKITEELWGPRRFLEFKDPY
jgi:serine/threonine protein kinase